MRKEVYTEKGAPPAGIYSQGIVADGPVAYIAGQGPLDPATGQMVEGGFREQATRVFDNLTILLEEAGTSWEHVTKVGVFLADLSDFAEMNEVYEQYVTKPYPARTTVGCQLPNIMLEVDCIAVVPE
ncbi:MAG: RidA family protein [Caldilineaceae bacterium SB0668_bin_21]|nr:Rid family detoxifying hydrolase [Caldilineaceae bacterium]MXX25005.1 RidA family protein [Caldilineaceae bacterium SB0668_bin_21]MYC21388.1 RidA family protein [Caldilineaceae bacterium SB0662_bin_25]